MENNKFISLDEYNQHIVSRVRDDRLRSEDLYTSMLRFDGGAFKIATRIGEIARGAGFVILKFTFLDDDLKDHYQGSAKLTDGYMNAFNGGGQSMTVVSADNSQHVVREGYLRDYFDDMYGFMREESMLQSV